MRPVRVLDVIKSLVITVARTWVKADLMGNNTYVTHWGEGTFFQMMMTLVAVAVTVASVAGAIGLAKDALKEDRDPGSA